MAELRILITGGGTGGHLFPALAIGEEIKNRNSNSAIQRCRLRSENCTKREIS